MKKLCLFDLDGTLIDPHTAITTGFQYALRSVGIEVEDRNQFNAYIGPPLQDAFRAFHHFTDAEVDRLVGKYREYFTENGIYQNHLYPGIIEMLNHLKAADMTLTIATSKLKDFAERIAKHLDFDGYFDAIVGCELDGTRGRKREVIDYILQAFDPDRQYAPVMIGDRKYDIIGAREMGIDSIGITWGYGSREELEQENPTMIVDSVEELCQVLVSG